MRNFAPPLLQIFQNWYCRGYGIGIDLSGPCAEGVKVAVFWKDAADFLNSFI